ncbi:hypothetical protein ACWDRB_42005 [Nonomuraea sp. NPDC003707]
MLGRLRRPGGGETVLGRRGWRVELAGVAVARSVYGPVGCCPGWRVVARATYPGHRGASVAAG